MYQNEPPLDDSHILKHLEERSIWAELEASKIKSDDQAIEALRDNLFGTEHDEEVVFDAIEHLCESYDLPTLYQIRSHKPSVVSLKRYNAIQSRLKQEVEQKNEYIKKQVERIISEICGSDSKDTLDIASLDSALKSIAYACDFEINYPSNINIKRKS